MAPTEEPARRCTECGATLDGRESKCWLCRGEIRPAEETNPYASPPASANLAASPVQFSLSTLMLVTTLTAVCLGVTMAAPGLGVLLIVLATPAFVRTMVAGFKQKRSGVPFTAAEKIATFCVSLAVMVMIGVAAVAAFQIACWGSCGLVAAIAGRSGDPALITGLIVGGIAGVGTIGWLLWLTRPRKPTSPQGRLPS